MWTGNDAIIVDFGAGLLGDPTPPTEKPTQSSNRGSESEKTVTLHSPRILIRGSPLYGYTGTSDIKEMQIQDYKAIAVMFFRFVNRFMWKLDKKIDNQDCYPFNGMLATDNKLLFDSDNCEKYQKSHKSRRSKRSCKCNYLNSDTELKKMLKKYLKKLQILENEPLTIFNRLWKSLLSGKAPQKLNKEHCRIVINILHLYNNKNSERYIFRNLTYLQTLITPDIRIVDIHYGNLPIINKINKKRSDRSLRRYRPEANKSSSRQKRRSIRKKKPPNSHKVGSLIQPQWKR